MTTMPSKGGRSMTDKKLLRIVTSFRHGILGRKESDFMCLAVCAPLQTFLLVAHDLRTEIVSGWVNVRTRQDRFFEAEHFWLELPDGRIIDPTHDQFGYEPKIYIGPLKDNYRIVDQLPEARKMVSKEIA